MEEWSAAEFEATLADRARTIVLFGASWCAAARAFLPIFERAEPEAVVPFARTDLRRTLDARWERYDIDIVPTLTYFEHGEALERCDGVKGIGLSQRDLDEFMETVANLQEEPRLPKRMHGPRRA